MPDRLTPDDVRFELRGDKPVLILDVPTPAVDGDWSSLNRMTVFLVDGPGEAGYIAARFSAYLDDDDLWRFAPCLVHGDIGPEHVLVSAHGDLVGVLDWEELTVDDPVADFAWLLNERPEQGERALAAYGGAPDPAFRMRGAFRWALMPFHEVVYGLDSGQEGFVASGIEGIRRRVGGLELRR